MSTKVAEHRTQVYLPETLYQRAAAFARAHGISLAELIRQGLSRVIEGTRTGPDPLLEIVGSARGVGVTDGSSDHDRYAYGRRLKRKRPIRNGR